MTTTLTNKHVKTFDDILKTYYNSFLKDIPQKNILAELNNITALSSMNIDGTTPVYTTDQLNKFIRNIINFNIKNFDNLKSEKTDTNMEFVGTKTDGKFVYNDKIKEVIIDKLNIINVIVDLLDAYKYCIDNENNGIVKSGYTDNVEIQSIQIVADTTRLYKTGAGAGMYPPVSEAPNAGYIKRIRFTNDAVGKEKTTLFLSIQSFNAKFVDNSNAVNNTLYNNLFRKFNGLTEEGTASANTVETAVTASILDDASSITPDVSNIDTTHIISNATYQRQIFLKSNVDATITNDGTRDSVNKYIIINFLKCLISIQPALRKQTVYALYYYYNFVQLYSTLVINICNVMYAKISDANQPFCIETINTTYSERFSRSISGIQITNAGSGYAFEAGKNFNFSTSHTTPSNQIKNAEYAQLPTIDGSLTLTRLPDITDRGKGYTESKEYSVTISSGTGSGAKIKTIIVPVAMANNRSSQSENIDRFEAVYINVITSISLLQRDIIKYGIDNNFKDKNIVIVDTTSTTTNSQLNAVRVKKNEDNKNKDKVIIIITHKQTIELLNKLENENDIVNNYYVYDNILKYNYLISGYENSTIVISGTTYNSVEITLDAYFSNDDANNANNDNSANNDKKYYDIFKNISNGLITSFSGGVAVLDAPSAGTFLSVNKKDLNQYRLDYNTNKVELSKLNEIIDMNERIVNNQKSLYDAQYNKNTFLNRQILIFNIIICIIVLILIIINVINVEKKHIKSISLACMGVILLLLVIYYISNVTYIESFAVNDKILKLKLAYAQTNLAAHGTTKKNTIDEIIGDINIKFISYFEKISVVLPSVDTTIFYKEIKDTTQADIYKKNYIDNILKSRISQSSNNMNALKYELENNKLYILTLLISSLIFVGLYNIYENYINDDKYVSLIIFISFLIFIIIISYYIINSNRKVRTTYKNIYWGPELSRDF